MPAEVETMFYVKEKPWHGLGTMVEEAPDSEQALVLAGLDWAVRQEPLYLENGTQVPGMVANVRATDGKVLGVVSTRYKVVQNREAFMWTDALLGEGVRYETAGSLYGGRKVWLLARLEPRHVLGEEFVPYLVFVNTHDGSGSIRVALTPIRVVCQNTVNMALRGAKRHWSARHTGDMQAKLDEARRTLQLVQEYMDEYADLAQILAKEKITKKEWNDLVDALIPPAPEDASDLVRGRVEDQRKELLSMMEAPDIEPFKFTKYGAIQAVADFTTHMKPLRNAKTFRERHFEALINGHKLLDKATKLLVA